MEVAFGNSFHAGASQNSMSALAPNMCEILGSKQTAMSALLLDIAWLLRKPHYDEKEASPKAINIKSLISLLKFLIQNEFFHILDGIMHHTDELVRIYVSDKLVSDVDLKVLFKCISLAREFLNRRNVRGDFNEQLEARNLVNGVVIPQCCSTKDISAMYFPNQELNPDYLPSSTHQAVDHDCEETVPLVTKELNHGQGCNFNFSSKDTWGGIFSTNIMRKGSLLIVLISVVMCLSACIVFLHPHKAREFVVSVRRSTFGGPIP